MKKNQTNDEITDSCIHDYTTCGWFEDGYCEIDMKECPNMPYKKWKKENDKYK